MGVCVCVFVELVCSKANMIYVNTQLSVRRNIYPLYRLRRKQHSVFDARARHKWLHSAEKKGVVCFFLLFIVNCCLWMVERRVCLLLIIPHHLILHFHSIP